MTNDIRQSLGLRLVKINVNAQFHHNITLGSREGHFHLFRIWSSAKPRLMINVILQSLGLDLVNINVYGNIYQNIPNVQGCLQILQCVDLTIFPGQTTQLIPSVFDWVQISRYGRLRKKVNVILCQSLSFNQCVVGSCIVMLQNYTGTLIMEKWYDVRTQDVDITIQITLHLI